MTKFREFVLSGKFNEAYNLSKNMEKKLISDELIAISFSTKNMLAYGFAVYALLKEENDEYHDIAISLLMNSYIDLLNKESSLLKTLQAFAYIIYSTDTTNPLFMNNLNKIVAGNVSTNAHTGWFNRVFK